MGNMIRPDALPGRGTEPTMVFCGYSSPKPLPADGTVLGTGSTMWTVSPQDPALHRGILTVTLTRSRVG
jgi:hypothetical protein